MEINELSEYILTLVEDTIIMIQECDDLFTTKVNDEIYVNSDYLMEVIPEIPADHIYMALYQLGFSHFYTVDYKFMYNLYDDGALSFDSELIYTKLEFNNFIGLHGTVVHFKKCPEPLMYMKDVQHPCRPDNISLPF